MTITAIAFEANFLTIILELLEFEISNIKSNQFDKPVYFESNGLSIILLSYLIGDRYLNKIKSIASPDFSFYLLMSADTEPDSLIEYFVNGETRWQCIYDENVRDKLMQIDVKTSDIPFEDRMVKLDEGLIVDFGLNISYDMPFAIFNHITQFDLRLLSEEKKFTILE
jgi:hypothetical protein